MRFNTLSCCQYHTTNALRDREDREAGPPMPSLRLRLLDLGILSVIASSWSFALFPRSCPPQDNPRTNDSRSQDKNTNDAARRIEEAAIFSAERYDNEPTECSQLVLLPGTCLALVPSTLSAGSALF